MGLPVFSPFPEDPYKEEGSLPRSRMTAQRAAQQRFRLVPLSVKIEGLGPEQQSGEVIPRFFEQSRGLPKRALGIGGGGAAIKKQCLFIGGFLLTGTKGKDAR